MQSHFRRRMTVARAYGEPVCFEFTRIAEYTGQLCVRSRTIENASASLSYKARRVVCVGNIVMMMMIVMCVCVTMGLPACVEASARLGWGMFVLLQFTYAL